MSSGHTAQYIALTLAIAGLQFAWSLETGFGSPYLLSLGLKKSLVSLVWLAGPLSGLVTQPLVGILSDKSTSRFGRRRPYIVGSTICSVFCLVVIGWTREIAGGHQTLTIWLAVAAFYLLDFAINCLQACLRALIVDVLPAARQDAGTAWASRMIGIGNVVGYLMGFLDLVHLLPFLGSTHMQILTTIASTGLGSTVAVTCYFTPETPISRPPSQPGDSLKALTTLFTSLRSLPVVIKRIFRIQLFAWIGWFPFLFYSTTYVADLYVAAHGSSDDDAEAMERGTRAGSLAMFAHAVVTLCSSLILPLFTYSTAAPSMPPPPPPASHSATALEKLWAGAGRARAKLSVSLPTMWAISLGVFSLAMLSTLVTSTVAVASALLAICGMSWAVAMWIPFSMIGEAIRSTSAVSGQQRPGEMHSVPGPGDYMQLATGDIPMEPMANHGADDLEIDSPAAIEPDSSSAEMSAGTILGVHNVFIVIPQFITAFASSLIFAVFEHMQETEPGQAGGHHARQIALVMSLGGLSAAAAVYMAWKLGH
ncbi:hypothetical protein GGF46_002632 [Coemansia sp. RSA 552]|nr:hypothetical protein GGF46_002632 [Coemansia sp. RSA 552]